MKKLILLLLTISSLNLFAHTPTWTKDIAKIIYKNCSNCHKPGGLAPFNLMSYDDSYNNRYSINASVAKKNMPPWPPDTKYSKLAHERVLTADEIHLIDEWVTNNAPYGNAAEEPAKPIFTSNEVITNPDISYTIPEITLNTTEDIYM
jgi:mono/diheme cytochrome c family protein